MGTQEWLLLGAVLVVPLIVAVAVTLWTLEQAIKRNRKNQTGRKTRRVSEPVLDTPGPDDLADARVPLLRLLSSKAERDGRSVDSQR